jgi:hypothetical protein
VHDDSPWPDTNNDNDRYDDDDDDGATLVISAPGLRLPRERDDRDDDETCLVDTAEPAILSG